MPGWIIFASVRRTPEANGLSLKEILKLAKKSYKKIGDNVNEKIVKSASPKKVGKSVRIKKNFLEEGKNPINRQEKKKKKEKEQPRSAEKLNNVT